MKLHFAGKIGCMAKDISGTSLFNQVPWFRGCPRSDSNVPSAPGPRFLFGALIGRESPLMSQNYRLEQIILNPPNAPTQLPRGYQVRHAMRRLKF